MLGRLVHSADFERMRAAPAWSRSAHFAVHHLPARPSRTASSAARAGKSELSTAVDHNPDQPVDDLPAGHWLGTVVPKRLARRSVTRNLLRRQIRCAAERHLALLPPGLWVVRLRSPFGPKDFISAASDILRQAAAQELDRLFCSRRAPR